MEQLNAILEEHKGKIVGIAGGVVVGVFVLRYGFWRTVFVAGLAGIGLWLGALADREGWHGVTERVSRLVQRDR